jgi:mRNA-degrading endonuclease RelE of RelBE toxin-antitoxin system
MPKITLSLHFIKAYTRLPVDIRSKVDKALRLLAENPRHPSLRIKPIQGAAGIYEVRVDQSYRMTYERLSGDVLQMRVVANHDDALKNP